MKSTLRVATSRTLTTPDLMRSPDGNLSAPAEGLSFWDHLEVLRHIIIRIAILTATLTAAMFSVMPWVFDRIILAPCRATFPTFRWLESIDAANICGLSTESSAPMEDINLINVNLSSQFMIHLSTSFWLAVILAVPAMLGMLWRFVAPGLYESERRPVRSAFAMGSVLFYLGVTVSYLIVFPLTLRFLAGYQLSPLIPNVISIDSYMDTLTGLSLMLGLAFELPLLSMVLGRIGLIHRGVFTTYRRHAIVVLTVLAALITPTGDPLSLMVVFIPLYLLWELSAVLVPRQVASSESQAVA